MHAVRHVVYAAGAALLYPTQQDDPGTGMTRRQPKRLDLGHQHFLTFVEWHPDDLPANRKLYKVPKSKPMPHIKKAGATVYHPNLKQPGTECIVGVTFEIPPMITQPGRGWKVESFEPLTLSPSLLCTVCGDHGFIRDGKWVPA
jgi:hypothetical protein